MGKINHSKVNKKPAVKKDYSRKNFNPASDKQKKYMTALGITFSKQISKAEAQAMISAELRTREAKKKD